MSREFGQIKHWLKDELESYYYDSVTITHIVNETLSYDHARKTTVPTLGLAEKVEVLDDSESVKNQEAGGSEEKQEALWDISDLRVCRGHDSSAIHFIVCAF